MLYALCAFVVLSPSLPQKVKERRNEECSDLPSTGNTHVVSQHVHQDTQYVYDAGFFFPEE